MESGSGGTVEGTTDAVEGREEWGWTRVSPVRYSPTLTNAEVRVEKRAWMQTTVAILRGRGKKKRG